MRISDWSSDVCSSDLEVVMLEVDLLVVLVIFVHRKIDDPAEFEHVLLDKPKHLAHPRPGSAREFGSLQFLACCKENAVIGTKTQRLDQFRGFFFPVVLGDVAAGHAVLDIDIAKTRMTFATCPEDRKRTRLNYIPECASRIQFST